MQYARTRHNIGWRVLDALAVQTGKDFRPGKGEYYVLESSFDGEPAVLIKPTTFMNGSGLAVAQAIERYEADIANSIPVKWQIMFCRRSRKKKNRSSMQWC